MKNMGKSMKGQQSTSSESDGPDDVKSPPSKKVKVAPAAEDKKSASGPKDETPVAAEGGESAGNSSGSSGSSGDGPWVLEKLRQVRVSEFRGRKWVDIREHYEKNGEVLPGKKGISLSLQQWKKLLEMADEITRAAEK